MDGETYLMPGFRYRYEIETRTDSVPVVELAKVWQPSRLKGIQVAPDHGVPFLTATQVFDLRPIPRKWISPTRTPKIEDRYLEPGWILVTCSGSVGDAIMSYAPHRDMVVSHDLLRVVPRTATITGYLYTYFRTHYGRAVMRSTKYGNIIKHLEPEHLEEIPVPLVGDDKLADTLNETIERVFALRDEAHGLEHKAERKFGEAVGLPDDPEADDGYTVHASGMFGPGRRLDGYHYNPTARRALEAIDRSGLTTEPLDDLTEEVFGVPRFKHIYTESGIPYLDSEPLFKVNPELSKFIPPGSKKNADAYYVHKGWILMACSGQLYGLNGNVVLADTWHEHKIVSNHVIRILPNRIRPGYLYAALNHPTIGQPLVLRCAFGTEVPEIPTEEVRLLPIVRLSESLEDEIADMIERASEVRMEADKLENGAVSMLERAIGDAIKKGKKPEDIDVEALGIEGVTPRGKRIKIDADFDTVMEAVINITPDK